jgi:hypothetical protein
MNPVRILPPYFPKIHSNIVLPSMPRSSKWSLPFRFSNQNIVGISCLSHTCYIPPSRHPPWFDHPNNNCWSVQVTKLLIMLSPPAPATCPFLGPNMLLRTLFSDTLNLYSSLSLTDEVSYPYNTKHKIRECFDLAGEWRGYIIRSFLICTLLQILLGWSRQGWYGGRGMWHAWDRWEIHIKFWSVNLKGINRLGLLATRPSIH